MRRKLSPNNGAGGLSRRMALLTGPLIVALGPGAVRAQSAPAPAETRAPTALLTKAVDELVMQDLLNDPASPILGASGGDVTMVEFFDYQCPYCKLMAPLLPKLIAADSGLRIVMKEFPILGPRSVFATRVALVAAAHGKYLAFYSAMFASEGPPEEQKILAVAQSIGLDPAVVRSETNGAGIEAELRRNRAIGEIMGIRGTPTFIIGGAVVPGAVPADELKRLISDERKRVKQ
jgi:protein-disulfide isomerase